MAARPGWLLLLLGGARADFVIAIARDALALLIVVGLLIVVTWIITKAGQLFGDTVHLLPYIPLAHEGIIALSIVALIVRSAVEMWNFARPRRPRKNECRS
jgi:nicotinamide riboside transporter PnuC